MPSMTPDQIIAHTMVFGTKADLARVKRELEPALGQRCPHCSATEQIEDNGATSPTFLCVDCGHTWEASEVEITVPEPKRRAYS